MKPFKMMMMIATMTCMEEKNNYANKNEFQVGFKPRIVYSSFNHKKRPSDALYMVDMGLVHDFSFVIMHSTFDFVYGAS